MKIGSVRNGHRIVQEAPCTSPACGDLACISMKHGQINLLCAINGNGTFFLLIVNAFVFLACTRESFVWTFCKIVWII